MRMAIAALILAVLAGCAHQEPKSPCVCDWKPINEEATS